MCLIVLEVEIHANETGLIFFMQNIIQHFFWTLHLFIIHHFK